MQMASVLAASMTATALGGAGLAAFLLLHARTTPGARPLAAFILLVGLWALGLLLPNRLGAALMGLAPLAAAVFVHFAARLSERCGCIMTWSYGIGGAATAAALANPSGRFVPWPGEVMLFRYEGPGLLAVAVTLALAGLGHLLLAEAWRRGAGKRRRQIGIVLASSGLGLATTSALAFPLVPIPGPPWPLVALPLYPAMLAYGMLRYELMAANQWARRTLTWGLVVALGAATTASLAGWVAAGGMELHSAVAVAVALALWNPLYRLVGRVIFPGGEMTAADIAAWRADLEAEADEAAIARTAEILLRRRLQLPAGQAPDLDDAPPGPRRIADMIQSLAEEARAGLQRRRSFAERQRLAELGALAAAVAHDLRNPMNIIAMAMADAEPSLRTEVKAQLNRMDGLVRDLLDYAKPWAVTPVAQDLAVAVGEAARGMNVASEIPPGLMVTADPLRLHQALGNLLANARAAGGRVLVAAEAAGGAVVIRVCDDGPGIPEDIRGSLFQPFVARGAGGTGLGLAIVAKVMAAHGGTVTLEDHPGWTTCFTLRFPA